MINIRNKKTLGLFAILVTEIIWSCSFIVKPILLVAISPVQTVFIQSFLAMIILGLYCTARKISLRIERKQIIYTIMSGMLGIGLYQILLNISIDMTGAIIPAIFTALIPAMCIITDFYIFKKRLISKDIISITASFIGVALIVKGTGIGDVTLLAVIILFFSNIVWIVYCYYNNKKQENINGKVFLFYQLLGCILMIFPYIIFKPVGVAVLKDWNMVWRLLYLSVVHATLAYIFFIFALSVLSVVSVNIANNLMPIVTLLVSSFIFKEAITLWQAFGIILVLISVGMSNSQAEESI